MASTDADQTALAPGKLGRTWTTGSRRYFEFASEKPMADVYGFLSARWVVTKTQWHGGAIEVYADPKHPWNVEHIVSVLKQGLGTYSSEYGPYGLSEIRVAEFPGYRPFGQSFAGMIPFSEALGFTSQADSLSGIDFPYFITAHELAHQWRAHQLQAADAPGALVLSESMAQYSAIHLVDIHAHAQLPALLEYEREQYRVVHVGVGEHEEALGQVATQPFVAHHKGGLALYDYEQTVGERDATAAFHDFIARYGEKGIPYPVAQDFIASLRSTVPASGHPRFDAWLHARDLTVATTAKSVH